MDPNLPGGDHRHLTWRDLPASPPMGAPIEAAPVEPVAAAAPVAGPAAAPRRRRGTMAVFAAGALAGVVALAGAATVGGNLNASPSGQHSQNAAPGSNPAAGAQQSPPAAPANPGAAGNSGSEPLADTAARILPSVVQIETGSGLGAGFIANSDGYILTANHVVSDVTDVTIRLQDNTTVPGKVVGRDTSIDTAVIKIERTDIPPLALGDSDQVRVGQVAIAVGSPFGFDQTVTNGIISGLNRTLSTDSSQMSDLIQTDAPINPGNSGGPLTDRNGTVIGINDAIASRAGQSSGVGFAIPINDAKKLLAGVKDGTVSPPSGPSAGAQTDPGNGSNPGNGTDPFGGLNPFGGSGNGPSDGSPGMTMDEFLQWFLQNVAPQLNQGQNGGSR